MFGLVGVCFFRAPGVDIRVALLAAIDRSNRLLLSRLHRERLVRRTNNILVLDFQGA